MILTSVPVGSMCCVLGMSSADYNIFAAILFVVPVLISASYLLLRANLLRTRRPIFVDMRGPRP